MIRWFLVTIALVLLCLLFPLTSKAQLKVGDRAPDFALQDQKGQTIKLSDFLGKKKCGPGVLHQGQHSWLNQRTDGVSG